MTTILVAGPRLAVHEQIERVAEDDGFATSGQPDIVLTLDTMTAKFWSGKQVPTIVDEDEDHIDVAGLMVTVLAMLEP